jgi:CubicO group peptidase (beta-lactamase class C family)
MLSLRVLRGGTYDFRRAGEPSDFYPRGGNPEPYRYRPPPSRDDGWSVGTLEAAGIDRAAVEAFVEVLARQGMDSVHAPQVHSLLIARHGRLVLEEYFHGEHRDKLHDTRSGSKSVTATLIGAAIQAGLPVRMTQPVYETMLPGAVPADLDPRARAMTLEHLLTMASGYFCDDSNPEAPGNESRMSNQSEEPNLYRYMLRVPMASAPGEPKGVYCSGNTNLALGVLGTATGESPFALFERLVAEPLRITRYAWGTDQAGNPYGGGSMQLLPRDYMKFGQLLLNGGSWNGRRVLSREFIAAATRIHTRLGSRERGYGYAWWLEEYPFRGRSISSWAMLGAGGQVVVVFPELDLVVASHGGSYSSNGWRYFTGEFLPKYILPAVSGAP